VREVLVESGAIVAGAFMQSGFVDELHCFIAPILMGNDAKPYVCLTGREYHE
jgi:Pyrimidine reductase, riboflavin biosynthesis